MTKHRSFPKHAIEELAYYVYRLVDPRNAQTFYVGKGIGNRVFDHVSNVQSRGAEPKADTIRSIIADGLDVIEIVHRFGLTEEIALEVEAALIDAYPGLTNLQSGHGVERSGTDANAMARGFARKPAKIAEKVLFVSVNRSLADTGDIERAARIAWPVGVKRAKHAQYVIAVRHGVIRAVFAPANWREATPELFPEYAQDLSTMNPKKKRYGFDIQEQVRSPYLDQGIPSGLKLSQSGFCYHNM